MMWGKTMFFCTLLLLLVESTGGILTIQQLFNSMKLSKQVSKWLLFLTYTIALSCSGKLERKKIL